MLVEMENPLFDNGKAFKDELAVTLKHYPWP